MRWLAALLVLPCVLGLLIAARVLARPGLCGPARRVPARPLFEDLGWFVRPSLFGGVFLGWSLLSRAVLVALVGSCAPMCHTLLLLSSPRRPLTPASAPARGAFVRLNAAPSPASPRPRARRRANARLPLLQDGWRRFLEHFFGSEVFFVLNRNVWPHLAVAARVPLFLLGFRLVQYARDAMGRVRGAWWLGAHALCVALRYRDPQFLLYWLQTRFQHMRLQAHQRYFRLLGVMLRAGVRRAPSRWYLRGVHMRVVGKISVTGNAMSRTQWTRAGLASTSSLGLQATESFTLVWTSTGCLGLTVVFFV